MKTKKYLVCPGHVISRWDGDKHYISAQQLIKLYGVDPQECVIYSPDMKPLYKKMNLITLAPSASGNYDRNIK